MTALAHSAEFTLAHLLTALATHSPDAPAIMGLHAAPLTYHRLQTHIDAVGNVLRSNGINHHDRVAIVLPNGPEMATAFLAVSTWAASAPLNPFYRAEEFDFYLTDLKAKALIVLANEDSPACTVARAHGIQILNLVPHAEAAGLFTLIGESQPGQSKHEPTPDDIALLLHTSGTTSRPKLVPLTQANLCTSARNIALTLALTSTDRCLNVMPLFHIHGLIGALLSSVTASASVVCTPGFSAVDFFPWLDTYCPTWYTAVPTIHQAILAQTQPHTTYQHSLRCIRSSSAALPLPVLKDLEQTFQIPVIESYGMTEAAHQMASNPLPPALRKPGSVGRAAGPEVAIMDQAGTLLPSETTGEVVIRGANVTLGYESQPTANATAFIHGWFRTGDQGYVDSDGYLFLTGRLKEIINRGGEKVAPREVDEVLLTHPVVAQAVTFALPHPTLGEDVAAAVVLRQGQQETAARIRQFLFGRVADFKIPSQVVIVSEIPKGPTGKIQRIGLATQLTQQLKEAFVAPRNEVEERIAHIMATILGIDRLGVNDNFFALGGDSLRATRVITRLRATFQVDLPIITLFKKPTVAELAEEITVAIASRDQITLLEALSELSTLSDEEARQILAAELGTVK